MQSQIQAHSRQFQRFLWEKPVKISLKIGSEWEENYSCTKAVCRQKINSTLGDLGFRIDQTVINLILHRTFSRSLRLAFHRICMVERNLIK